MASLRDIRKRLRSIENIQQLTKAMEMVAASRLHQAQNRIKQALTYSSKIKEIVDHLISNITDFTHPLVAKREVKKVGLVIISADMGLCGAYNKDAFTAANKFLKNYSKSQVELILIGRKAVEHYTRRDWTIRFQDPKMTEMKEYLIAKSLVNDLMSWYLHGELDEIWFVYTHYVTMLSKKVVTEKLLNIDMPSKKENTPSLDYIYEPSPAEILGEILFRYSFAKVISSLDEAYASELAARVFAMKTATKNADDMIKKLTLIRNKVRQAEITKEMLEITSGAEYSK